MSEAPRHRAERSLSPWLLIIPVVIVALAVGGFVLFKGGSEGRTPGNPPSSLPPSVPAFSFKLTKVEAVPTNATRAKKLSKTAKGAASAVGRSLSDMYRSAFLDQAAWQSGNYDTVWSYFDAVAAADAKNAVDTLTLGTHANDTFSSVAPGNGSAKVQILMDDHNKPTSALATVKFLARATSKAGPPASILSTGSYFLKPAGKTWVIYGYRVSRKDRSSAAPKPTTSSASGGSPSP